MKPTTEPTARLSSGRLVTESEVRTVLERAGLSYPLPRSGADLVENDLYHNGGRGSQRLLAAIDGRDTDADTLTMADHLALHPEDRSCPWCCPPGWLPEECPRCLGDQRMGVVCPRCNGEGEGIDGWDCSPGCRCGRLVEATDGE